MPTGLERRHPTSGVHFITASCFRRQPLLGTSQLRDRFQTILFETQSKYPFQLKSYVLMPEHMHLLLRPEGTSVATIMQVLKQRYARHLKQHAPALYGRIQIRTACPNMPVWEPRYYDTNPDSPEAVDAIAAYIHHNPVKRDLVPHLQDWRWSSYQSHQQVHLHQTD